MLCRKSLGLTQDQLAEKLGVTAQAVSKWENDQSCPDITMLPKLAAIFGTTTDALLGHIPPETPQEETAHQGEVVTPDGEDEETGGIHLQNGNWEFHFDSGRLSALCFALLVLAVGGQLITARVLQSDIGFWGILWPTALVLFGAFGLLKKFSCMSLGFLLFGTYFLLDNWDLLPFTLGGELVFPVVLVLFGCSLLVDALKKPRRARASFHRKGNGHSGASSRQERKNDFRIDETSFSYHASFGESTQHVNLPMLEFGEVNISFGEFTIDFSGVEAVSDHCSLDANCAFGELVLRIPRRYQVVLANSSAFASIDTDGEPNARPEGMIHLNANASFGSIEVHYI